MMRDLRWPWPALTLLHAAARCLALVAQNRLCLTRSGDLQRPSRERLMQYTADLDWLPLPYDAPQAPTAVFLLALLQQAGMVAGDGERLLLSDKALEWLARPTPSQLDVLRQVWFRTPELTWCWVLPYRRIESDPGGAALQSRRWRNLILETLALVGDLPLDKEPSTRQILAALQARRRLTWDDPAQNLPRIRDWRTRRTRQVLHFLLQSVLPGLHYRTLLDKGCEFEHLERDRKGHRLVQEVIE